MSRTTPARSGVTKGRRAGQTARAMSGDRVPLRFRALLTAIRVDGGLRLPPPTLDLPLDVAEICGLVRQASPVGRQLVEAVFDDAAAPLRQATYLNEQATLATQLGEDGLIETLNTALDEMRRDIIHPNDALGLLMECVDAIMLPEVTDLWSGKGALEKLSMCLDIRRLVYAQIRDLARPAGLDAQLELEYRAQTVEWLQILAALCDRMESLLHERLASDTHGEQSEVSLALFAAYADRARFLGEPLPIQMTTWLEEWRLRQDDRRPITDGRTAQMLAVSGQLSAVVAGVGVVGATNEIAATPLRVATPVDIAKTVWPNGQSNLAKVTTPWAAPAPEWGDWTYTVEAAPDVNGPVPQLRLQLTTTGTYALDDLALYFGLTSRQAMGFLTQENTDALAKVKPTAKALPAGLTLVVPATLLPTSAVRALEDTAQTFDVDVTALARLNPNLVTRNAAGQPILNPNAAGFLLTPVGRADRLSQESMTTTPLQFDIAGGQSFTAQALFGGSTADGRPPTAENRPSSAVGGQPSAVGEAPLPRQRHVRLHHTLTEATTIAALAGRLGLPTGALAEYNGVTDMGKALPTGTQILIPGTSYRTVAGDTLAGVATRYEMPAQAIEFLNGPFFVGQTLFIPQPPSRLLAEGVFEARPAAKTAPTSPTTDSRPPTAVNPPTAASRPSASISGLPSSVVGQYPDYIEMPLWLADWDTYKATEATLRAKYGQKLYPTVQSMPDDLREFYLMSVYWGAKFIGVPWQAVLAIHNTEIVGKGYRPFEQAVSTAAARGPGQITPGYWNGWGATSRSAAPYKNFADIIKGGGNGFHWGLRAEWLRYLRHEVGLDALKSTDADIMYLINNVVGTARGLHRSGVTTTAFPADPKQWSAANYKTLRNAAMIYNSGGTNPNVRQCAGCAWTVGDYGANSEKVAKALPASPFEMLPTEARMRVLRQELYLAYDREFAAPLSSQQLDGLLKSNSEKVGDLNVGKSEPAQVAQAIITNTLEGWLKVAERQPNEWPYFVNREAMATQRLAARSLATLLDKPSLEAIMQRHNNDVKAIETELTSRVDAMLVQTARETLERVSPGRAVLNTTLRPLVDQAIKDVFKGDLDPSQPGLDQRLAAARKWMEGKAGLGPTAMAPSQPANPSPPTPLPPGGEGGKSAPAAPSVPPVPNGQEAVRSSPPAPLPEGEGSKSLSPSEVAQALTSAVPLAAGLPSTGPTRQAAELLKPGVKAAQAVRDLSVKETSATPNGVPGTNGSTDHAARITPPDASVSVPVSERFIRLSAQVKTSNSSIQNNIRLFAVRAAGRVDDFRLPGAGVKIDWKKLQAADVEAVITLKPGEKLDYNKTYGPFSTAQGYASGPLVGGGTAPGVGACQVATLFKAAAKNVPTLKVWNGVKHPTIPGLEDTPAVSIYTGDARQNMQITNTGATPVIFRMRVVGDTATMKVEVVRTNGGIQTVASRTTTIETTVNREQGTGDRGQGETTSAANGTRPTARPANASAQPPAPSPQPLALSIVAGAQDLVGKYAYGNLRAGPKDGYYVCTDVVNYATQAAGVPIVQNYKDPATVRWVGTHLSWFKGQAVNKMVNTRQREFKPAATLPEAGWVIFIRREPYKEASHEGIVKAVEVSGDTATVVTLEALGAFKGDAYNKANNVQETRYTYQRGADGGWQQTGLNRTNNIVGYGVVKG